MSGVLVAIISGLLVSSLLELLNARKLRCYLE
jgi:hypothetical protein